MTSSDRFPVPVRSAAKSNFTDWCCQNLSKHSLNALTVQASTTELGKLFQIFTMRAEKNAFVSHNKRYDFANRGCTLYANEPVEKSQAKEGSSPITKFTTSQTHKSYRDETVSNHWVHSRRSSTTTY